MGEFEQKIKKKENLTAELSYSNSESLFRRRPISVSVSKSTSGFQKTVGIATTRPSTGISRTQNRSINTANTSKLHHNKLRTIQDDEI
jgi:hypothetical protein